MTMDAPAIAAGRSRKAAAMPAARRSFFYVGMGLVAVGIVILGFVPGIAFNPTPRHGPPTPLGWLHTLAFTSWLALYLTQAVLARQRKLALHRRLGWLGVPVALAALVMGCVIAIEQGRRGFALWWDPAVKADPLADLVHPFGDLLTFAILTTAGIVWRRRPEVHKRLMLLATVGSLMAAPLAHVIAYFPVFRPFGAVILLPLAALYFSSAVYDRVARGHIHPVSLWGGVALLAFAAFRAAVIGPSAAWHQFAGWLTS